MGKLYVSKHPNFSMRLGDKRYTFWNGQLELENQNHIKILDDALKTNASLAAEVSSVKDKIAAAEATAGLKSTQLQAFAPGQVTSMTRPRSLDQEAVEKVLQSQAAESGSDQFATGAPPNVTADEKKQEEKK